MARWKNFLGQDRKKSHGQKMAAYMSRNNMRKQFLRWKTSIYFVTHTASHTDIARGVAAMNIARLHTWWKKFKQLGAWQVWCDHRRKENKYAQANRKIRRNKKQKFYEIWVDKYYRRQQVRKMLAGSARLICSRMIKKWHCNHNFAATKADCLHIVSKTRKKISKRRMEPMARQFFPSLSESIINISSPVMLIYGVFSTWHRNSADRKYSNLKCFTQKNVFYKIGLAEYLGSGHISLGIKSIKICR